MKTDIHTLNWEYKAFLLTIESYSYNHNLVKKLSLEFINGTYSNNHKLGCSQICSGALEWIKNNDNLGNGFCNHYYKILIAEIYRYIKSLDVNVPEYEMAISPFLIFYKKMPKKFRLPKNFVVETLKCD